MCLHLLLLAVRSYSTKLLGKSAKLLQTASCHCDSSPHQLCRPYAASCVAFAPLMLSVQPHAQASTTCIETVAEQTLAIVRSRPTENCHTLITSDTEGATCPHTRGRRNCKSLSRCRPPSSAATSLFCQKYLQLHHQSNRSRPDQRLALHFNPRMQKPQRDRKKSLQRTALACIEKRRGACIRRSGVAPILIPFEQLNQRLRALHHIARLVEKRRVALQ